MFLLLLQMSLLGKQVFANPTTPLWGGGGGSNTPNPTFQSVSFTPVGSPVASSQIRSDDVAGSTLIVEDPSGNPGPLCASSFYAAGPYGRIIYQNNSIDYQEPSTGTSHFLATVNSEYNGWDLTNVSSINGSNYPPSGGTDPTFNIVSLLASGTNPPVSTGIGTIQGVGLGSAVSILGADQTQLGPLQATAFFAGVEANYPRVIYQSDSIDYQDGTGTSHLLAHVDASANGWDLSNISTINGAAYPPPAAATYPVNRFTLSNNAGATVLAAGTPVVGLYYEPTANGRVYANASCSFTVGSNVSPSAALTVAANLVVSDIVSVPAVAEGNTSAFVQWEFGVQAGTAYDFIATATAGRDGDFTANAATMFLSFIPS